MELNKSNRSKGLDILKCIASFLVICIHSPFVGEIGKYFNVISRCAVPIFFMITGFFYKQTLEKGKENKQIIKIIKLSIISNLLYFLFTILINVINGESIRLYINNTFTIKNILNWILFNESPIAGHLWYLNALLYVLIIVKFVNKYNKMKILHILTPFLLITDVIFGKYSLITIKTEVPYVLLRNFLIVGIPYFCIGNYISEAIYKKRYMKPRKRIYILCILFFILTSVLERAILINFNVNAIRDHYISTTFLSVFAFLYFLSYENNCIGKVVEHIAKIGREYCTEIYILHPIIITIFSTFFGNIIIYRYISPIFIFVCTTIVCIILKKLINVFKNYTNRGKQKLSIYVMDRQKRNINVKERR